MRESKFRGKRLDNGEWEHGDLVRFGQKCHTPCKCAIIPGTALGSDPLCKILFDYEVDSATVGQYTGLKDNKSTEIYEGDIVQLDYITTCGKHRIGLSFEVRWSTQEGCWFGWDGFVGNALQQMHKMFVVKGNIHDNPELLKTE